MYKFNMFITAVSVLFLITSKCIKNISDTLARLMACVIVIIIIIIIIIIFIATWR